MNQAIEYFEKNLSLSNNGTNSTFIKDNNEECFIPPLEPVSPEFKVFLIAIYSISSLMAFLGNFTVIVVEIFGRTPTNSLGKLLINMAISDAIMGVLCVPLTYTDMMLGSWIFAFCLCPYARFIQLLSIFVTSFSVAVIGIERYMAIIHPLSHSYNWMKCHTNLLLFSSWLFGLLYAFCFFPDNKILESNTDNNTYYCWNFAELSPIKEKVLVSSNFILTFMIPLIVMTVSYRPIKRRLLAGTMVNTEEPLRRHTETQSETRPVKMMTTVVLFYGICLGPIKTYQVLIVVCPKLFEICTSSRFYSVVTILFTIHWLAMSTCFVNPIIYSFMSENFRANFRRVIRRFIIRSTRDPAQVTARQPTDTTRIQDTKI